MFIRKVWSLRDRMVLWGLSVSLIFLGLMKLLSELQIPVYLPPPSSFIHFVKVYWCHHVLGAGLVLGTCCEQDARGPAAICGWRIVVHSPVVIALLVSWVETRQRRPHSRPTESILTRSPGRAYSYRRANTHPARNYIMVWKMLTCGALWAGRAGDACARMGGA